MKLTDLFIRRPVLAIVVNLVISIAGLQAIRTLNVRQYPKLESATVTVRTAYVGASAELVAGCIERLQGEGSPQVGRLGYAPTPCPTTKPLENLFYPNARTIAAFLESHELAANVTYAGLPASRYRPLVEKYLPRGAGAVFSFDCAGGRAGGQDLIRGVTLWSHLANVGDAKTLVLHPASTTHQQMSPEQLATAGVGESRSTNAVFGVIAWLAGLLFFFPVLWTVLNSFKDEQDANTSPSASATQLLLIDTSSRDRPTVLRRMTPIPRQMASAADAPI